MKLSLLLLVYEKAGLKKNSILYIAFQSKEVEIDAYLLKKINFKHSIAHINLNIQFISKVINYKRNKHIGGGLDLSNQSLISET